MYSANQIALALGGQQPSVQQLLLQYLSVDSRKISFPAQTIFFALVTPSRNGHQFLQEVYNQGVRCLVVSEKTDTSSLPEAVIITVSNTLLALQQLAAWHRNQYKLPVIGITGSNGKTIVKEWLNILLQDDFSIARSPKSYNSQIGVPLSVWQLNSHHTLGIFEVGISQPGEMQLLQPIIQPTIGILTNIGTAHSEGFLSTEQKLAEKLRLFTHVETLVCCTDDVLIRKKTAEAHLNIFSWGKADDCNIQVLIASKESSYTMVTLKEQQTELMLQLPFTDDASIENALHCIASCRLLGLSFGTIATRLANLHPIEMRLEWKKAINNCHILNDSYSNDISSLIIALDYLQQQQQGNRETVILSDFVESGLNSTELYSQVAMLLKQKNITRLIAIGSEISSNSQLFTALGLQTAFYSSTDDFITNFGAHQFSNESILLKGARKFGFERIAQLLELQVHRTLLEINLTSLANNLQQYRQLLKPGTKMMVMVKAFGYGSGDAEIAKLLQFNKVDYLGVAYTDEGVALRKAGIHLPVMVMNPEPTGFELLESNNLEPELYSFDILQQFARYCETQGITQYPIHIKLDTGMHRLGFEPAEAEKLGAWLAMQQAVMVKSVFTHLVASEDEAEDDFSAAQAASFTTACNLLEKTLGYSFIRHAANTNGIRRHPDKHFDMVRLGIGLYGGAESAGMQLKPVITLKTAVAQLRNVKAGETVGYNRRGKVNRDSVIATVRIGYADGYPRALSNGIGYAFLHGHRAPVIGNVCMDMTMIDVTDIPAVIQTGDEVELFGSHISLGEIASWCHTISYEIMTGISQRVKRVYVQE